MPKKGIDYSKWDKIDDSDDEEVSCRKKDESNMVEINFFFAGSVSHCSK